MTPRAAAALLPLTALALGGCTRKIDEADAEAKIAGLVRQNTGTRITVDCPGGIPSRSGERFTCTSSVSGAKVDIGVQMVSDDGRFKITEVRPRAG